MASPASCSPGLIDYQIIIIGAEYSLMALAVFCIDVACRRLCRQLSATMYKYIFRYFSVCVCDAPYLVCACYVPPPRQFLLPTAMRI